MITGNSLYDLFIIALIILFIIILSNCVVSSASFPCYTKICLSKADIRRNSRAEKIQFQKEQRTKNKEQRTKFINFF